MKNRMPKSNLEKSKKFRQALKKVIATGLSVLALIPMTKSFVPSTLKAFKVGKNKNEKDNKNNSNIEQNNQVSKTEVKKEDKNYGSSLKNKFKNLSTKEKILVFGASAVVALGSIACLAKLNSGKKKDDDSSSHKESDDDDIKNKNLKENESNIPISSRKKILLIGDSKSGKTTFLTRMSSGGFSDEHKSTVGADFFSIKQKFNGQEVQFIFWDTAGEKIYRNLGPMYYRAADLVLIFIDLSKNIDQQLNTWFKNFKDRSEPKTKAMVILSRPDLFNDSQEEIESIKQIIAQKISNFGLNERVTLFENPISSQTITDEEILKFENEIYETIVSQP